MQGACGAVGASLSLTPKRYLTLGYVPSASREGFGITEKDIPYLMFSFLGVATSSAYFPLAYAGEARKII